MNPKDRWDAQYYKDHSQGQYKKGIAVINKTEWKGNEKVLDVGCGDGRITAAVAKKVPQGYVLGIDVSQNMIDEAIKSFGDIKNLSFKHIDATKFSSDKIFDIAISFSTFHWIKDQLSALKNIYNALKTGGKLHIKLCPPYKSPISKVYKSQKWKNLLKRNEKTFFPQTIEYFSNMLEKSNFKNIDIKRETNIQYYQNQNEIFRWLFAWVPHSTGLPTEQAKEFTQDIVDSICSANKNGELTLKTIYLDVRAEKQ